MASTDNEVDLVVKFAGKKGGGPDGQLIIDDVELSSSRDNRTRHGLGNEEVQHIERGNKTHTFSTTCMMNDAAAEAMRDIRNGDATTQAVYALHQDDSGSATWKDKADGMVWNEETMAEFMADPRGYIKGTKMSFAGLRKDEDIAAVTEYLKSFSQ